MLITLRVQWVKMLYHGATCNLQWLGHLISFILLKISTFSENENGLIVIIIIIYSSIFKKSIFPLCLIALKICSPSSWSRLNYLNHNCIVLNFSARSQQGIFHSDNSSFNLPL